MSTGYAIAVAATPFFDTLDAEEETLSRQVLEANSDDRTVSSAMESTRRRLAQAVDSVVRRLPATVRSDLPVSRGVAYALIGLADERMLHHPAGGLSRWREKLLESELYGSALAGQEIVRQARAIVQGTTGAPGTTAGTGDLAVLAPLYLGMFHSGFEGSLRADAVGLSTLVGSLEEIVGAGRAASLDIATDIRPRRLGLSPTVLMGLGVATWLIIGPLVWHVVAHKPLEDARQIAERVVKGLPGNTDNDPLKDSIGPSGLGAPETFMEETHEIQIKLPDIAQ